MEDDDRGAEFYGHLTILEGTTDPEKKGSQLENMEHLVIKQSYFEI